MAKGVNKVILLGHVGSIDKYETKDGSTVVKLSLATNEKWKDKNSGEEIQNTEWHRVVIFRRLAEIAAQYLEKGMLIYVEGQLKTSKYTDDKGTDFWNTDIICNTFQMCGKSEGVSRPPNPPVDSYAKSEPYYDKNSMDDMPF